MKKLSRKNNNINNKKVTIISSVIVVLIMMISFGYSSFSQSLGIGGISAEVRIEKDIRVTGVSVSKSTDMALSTGEDYNVKNIYSTITLPNENSSVTYRVEITNIGNVEMGILKITTNNENLEAVVTSDYKLKEKICVDGKCSLGIKKYIDVEVKYKDNKFNKENIEYNVLLTFDFRPFHSVKYYGFDVDTDSYPKEVLEGNDLIINFDSQVKLEYVNAYVGGEKITFESNSNTIKIKNVSGDVVFRYKTLGEYVLELGKDKTCHWGDQNSTIIQTDNFCNGDSGFNDPPPYHKYLIGTNDCLNFNYVWYSGYMWRITEILNDGSIKMITENILSAINFGETGDFENSYIKQWLNEDFRDTLYNYKKILVTDAEWEISGWYSWCYIAPPSTTKATVGLLSSYEFNKTSAYGNKSFLNLGHSWWFSSPINLDPPYTAVAGINPDGTFTGWPVPNNAFGVRPMVVLRADVKFKGAGTKNDPFVLLDDIEPPEPGEKINTRTPGELVEINDMLYRIVNTHNEDGKLVTKLKSANYVTDSDDNVIKKKFGDMVSMHSYKDVVNSGDEQYWGAYLNGSWLTDDLKKYLVKDTYYVDNVQKDPNDSNIGSYKNTICKNKNTTETTENCEKTEKTWKGYVGLPIVGELFAYPLGGNDIHDYLTATMTPYGDGGWPMIGAFEPETQGIFQETYDQDFAVKPTITLKDNVIITGGDGKTPQTAFTIGLE